MPVKLDLKIDKEALERSYEDVIKRMSECTKSYVEVGYIDQTETHKGESKPITNLLIAQVQEFGSNYNNVPARPFLYPALDDCKPRIIKALNKAIQGVLNGYNSMPPTLEVIGTMVRDRAKGRITQQVGFAPLSPWTLRARKRKGFKGTKALIITGQLRNAIQYKVTR